MKKTILVVTLILSFVAEAGRGKNQRKRIEGGVNSGSLNEKEAARLSNQQQRIQENREEYKADGELDKKEKAKLHHQRQRASKNIYKQKHDKQESN
ncbi:MAG: hypothetical protein K2P81_01230 [Bacteriovoracaceae bacterium]|nr:hypothetical protein [Bacteriovoracaceae bacterium]